MSNIPWAPAGLFPPLIPTRKEGKRLNVITMRFNTYCSNCDILMKAGQNAVKVDGATFHHVTCPNTRARRFAAHKQPDTGMVFERRDDA